MTSIRLHLACLAVLLASATLPARADSSAASSLAESLSTSVGSVSDSVKRSSNSSSGDDKAAAGDYRILEVADGPRPGTVGLKLQPVADAAEDKSFWLYVPQTVADTARLALGQTVTARPRPYGTEFAQGRPLQPFFLVMQDAWYRELQTRAVTL